MNKPLPTYTQISAPRRKASFSIPTRLSILNNYNNNNDYNYNNKRRNNSFVGGGNLFGKDFLLSRGRITNLGILLLIFITLISLLINLRLYYFNVSFNELYCCCFFF